MAGNSYNNPKHNSGRNNQKDHTQRSGRTGSSNVTEFRRSLNVNIGLVICVVALIYVSIFVIRYLTAKHVVGYEVRTGSISDNKTYTGIALRTEEVRGASADGYVHYYYQELERVGVGESVCILDSSGTLDSGNAGDGSETGFDDADYQKLSGDIVAFTEDYDPASFHSVYELKTTLSGDIQRIAGSQLMNAVRSADSAATQTEEADNTGYLVYSTDGFEDKTFDSLTAGDFDQTSYQKTELANDSWVNSGDPVYRMELAEDWDVVIMVESREDAEKLQDAGVIRCRFLKNQYEAYATVGGIREADQDQFMVDLKFSNSMMAFATDRFVRIELMTDDVTGLKIPETALVDDDFYMVPGSYVTAGASGNEGVLREVVDSDGEKSVEFVTVTPYTKNGDNDHYYLEQTALRDGDVLRKPDSSDTLTLDSSLLQPLTGVYNINEGYADFRQVTKLAENDGFAIVESNTAYGLREYDFIVLNAAEMSPDEFIYE